MDFLTAMDTPGDIGIAASRHLLIGGRLAILVTGHVLVSARQQRYVNEETHFSMSSRRPGL